VNGGSTYSSAGSAPGGPCSSIASRTMRSAARQFAAGAIVGYRCPAHLGGRLSDLGPGSRLGLARATTAGTADVAIEKPDEDASRHMRWDEIALGTAALIMLIMLIIAG